MYYVFLYLVQDFMAKGLGRKMRKTKGTNYPKEPNIDLPLIGL